MSEQTTPDNLNDDAIVLVGLAVTLQRQFEESLKESKISDAMNLSLAYMALSHLAKTLADRIGEHAA